MTALHVLARFDRVRELARRTRSTRGVVVGNLFLTLCMAADDAEEQGVCATKVAATVGMSVRNARIVLSALVMSGMLTVRHVPSRAGGRPRSRYHATSKVYDLLGFKPVEKRACGQNDPDDETRGRCATAATQGSPTTEVKAS